MLFSYYFDAQKTHLLNCEFKVLQFTEKEAGAIEIMFSASVAELLNGGIKKKEVTVSTFTFPYTEDNKKKHDIDFTRVRYDDQQKWIFTIINNKDPKQKVSVGLITASGNKNPLGLDVYHNDEAFNAELKANNLSILENDYIPPVLTQTLVSNAFEQPGYPERFSSYSANYDTAARNYTVKDFRQDFLEPIPEAAPFRIEMDIAPLSMDAKEGQTLFTIDIPNLGTIHIGKAGLDYLIAGGRQADLIFMPYNAGALPTNFYNSSMTANARMQIIGDGNGALTITYAGKTIKAAYDQTKTYAYMDCRGAYVGKKL